MASVYTNDLRLEEIGSGEQSGTWGDTTNTNLELIAEAFSFGTETITTNADTHTTTIADGATDPGRSMFLKYTGTLDSACTITIAPNTVSKMWFIENGTSGSQNIIISQGSGANITIPPGDTKAIYSDGAGSGAAMVDAFASLNVVDLKVQDDLTVTDDMTVGGTLGVTGVVTANAGVVVDNFTLDGTTLALSSGTMILDSAGQVVIDTDDEGTLTLKNSGTQYGTMFNQSNDFKLKSLISDGDIVFLGNDGGAQVIALTLDMSAAGAATFNGVVTANAGVVVDEMTLDGDTLTATDDFIIDAVGDITLDADGGFVVLKDGGTTFGALGLSGGNFRINADASDSDIVFVGNDGGASVTALTLDMSDAGTAIFNKGITTGGGTTLIKCATDDNIRISQQTHASVQAINDAANAFVDLKLDGSTVTINGQSTGGTVVGNGLTLTNGNLVVADGHGINFAAQTASSATGVSASKEELLNHYEQGAFTPTLANSGGVPVDAYTAAVGFYVRIGARVTCHGYIIANGISNTGDNPILLGGFPFDAVNITNGHNPLCVGYGEGLNITAGHHIGGYLGPNTTNAVVQLWDVATGTSNMTFGELSADGGFMFSISYNAV